MCKDCCSPPEQKLPMALQVSGNTLWERTWPNRSWLIIRQIFLVVAIIIFSITVTENILKEGIKSLWWIWITHFILLCSCLYFILSLIVTIKVYRYIGDWNPANDGTTSIPMPTSQEVGIQVLSWCTRAFLSFIVSGQIVVCINFVILILSDKYDTLWPVIDSLVIHGAMTLIVSIDFLVSCQDLPYQSVILTCLWTVSYLLWSFIFNIADLDENKGNDYVYNLLKWKSGGNDLRYAIAIGLFTLLSSISFQILLVFMKKRILSWKVRHELWISVDDHEHVEDSELAPLHPTYNY